MKHTKNIEIKKLKELPYGQAFVEYIDNNNIYLWSYTTLVAQIENGWLTINGLYSATTRRHIGCFMREYVKGGNYQLAKQFYYDNMAYNINTGEVVERG